MNIGFDAKRLFYNNTGLGVYSRLLVDGLVRNFPEHQYLLFAKSPWKSKFYPAFKDLKAITRNRPLWRTWSICEDIKREQCNLFHGLSHELPIGIEKLGIKSIVTIHDLIFKVDPTLYRWIDRMIYDKKWEHSCNVADSIVAVSQHTKRDLQEYYDVDPTKVQVIPPPVEQKLLEVNPSQIRDKYKLPELFYLYVGSLTRRKNVKTILHAMLALPESDRVPLVIVGDGKRARVLKEFVYANRMQKLIMFVGHISSVELPAFYQLSFGLIYPSLYEGFGIPIVESLLNKKPVITSNTSSMPEAAGPGGLLIDPRDSQHLAQEMAQLCNDSVLYGKLVEAGHKHALQFSPDNISSKQMQVYRDLQ